MRGPIVRAAPCRFELTGSAGAGTLGTLRGLGAVFGQWARIESTFEGRFMERIAPGAFARSIRDRRDEIKVLFQHGRDPQVGDKPLGPLAELREEPDGLVYEVPLLDTSYNRDLKPGLEAGLYGSSFRFSVVREDLDPRPARSESNPDGLPERTVTDLTLFELGPVTFPAYLGATAGVRSLTDRFAPDEGAEELRRLIVDLDAFLEAI
jgi:HK97 family phage prohead protease